ncbi:NAD-dependent epimerase/dehydratase family protein [Motilibacter aurantiacus]|uniref:NAD-dependent epimerase/dehydratase family protein n=1 Tax=Motilibacter aurantiacus TaxID=2714955 RepID=UPI00140C4EB8|nr:NAD-dependent epimerase/dehydratase family protein [Motilibacter aurantiacus]NHC45378.1 NAD-dependent epimerase/dehydratase family protein [Motilibacter aurantiacus]
MRVVVTGASGNVGSALLRALHWAQPDWDVVGLARRPPEARLPEAGTDVTWHAVDVSDPASPDALRSALAGADAVVHLAWAIQPNRDQAYLARVNLDGTRRVLDASRAVSAAHLVVASSIGAYAPAPAKPVVDESWPTTGIRTSHYSRHKAAVERMLDAFESAGPGPAVTRLRPGLVLQAPAGSEIGRYFLGRLAPLVRAARSALPVLPLPDGLVANVVHADDLADAIVRILQRRSPGAFNIAADQPIDPATIARSLRARRIPIPFAALRAGTELSWRAHVQPTDGGWLDMARYVPLMSTARAKAELGWAPRHTAEETLTALVDALADGQGWTTPVLAPR